MTGERRGRVPSDVVEKVREAIDIVELVGQYVTLKRSGRSYKGLCPFHTEKTPSFTVAPDRQMYYCFGCQRGGDVFSFVMEQDGVSFLEALQMLAGRAGIEVGPQDEQGNEKDVFYAAAEYAAKFFNRTLHGEGGERARAYLAQRSIKRETAERFRLGAAPASWDALGRDLEQQGIPEAIAQKLGLVAARAQGGGSYDTFRDRLIFPIQSLSGRVIGFGGRILPGPEADRAPKYVNSADSPIYHKGRILYGLSDSRGAIRRQDAAIITEGYLDYLTLFQAGIENVVAACGTAFGAEQAALLHRYTHRAYILGDSDAAGRRAAVRTAGLLLEHGFLVHVVELPSGEDPDGFVRGYGAEALETRLREAPGYITYMKLLVDRRAGDLDVKERVVRHLLKDLGRVSDPLLQELYTKEICRSFALKEATVAASLGSQKVQSPSSSLMGRPEPQRSAASPALREAQRGLLRMGLTGGGWGERLIREFDSSDFDPGVERRIFEAICAAGSDAHWRDFIAAEDQEANSFGSQLEIEGPLPGEPERLFHDYRARLIEARLVAETAELERRIQEAESRGDEDAVDKLAEKRQALARNRSELRRPPSKS